MRSNCLKTVYMTLIFVKNDRFRIKILLVLSHHLKIVLRKLVELLYVSENVLEHALAYPSGDLKKYFHSKSISNEKSEN